MSSSRAISDIDAWRRRPSSMAAASKWCHTISVLDSMTAEYRFPAITGNWWRGRRLPATPMTSPLLAHSHRRSIPILERNCGCVFGFSGERVDEGVDEGFDGRGAFGAVLGSVDAARESERGVFVGERVETVEQDRG
jgi:hypothetical protein